MFPNGTCKLYSSYVVYILSLNCVMVIRREFIYFWTFTWTETKVEMLMRIQLSKLYLNEIFIFHTPYFFNCSTIFYLLFVTIVTNIYRHDIEISFIWRSSRLFRKLYGEIWRDNQNLIFWCFLACSPIEVSQNSISKWRVWVKKVIVCILLMTHGVFLWFFFVGQFLIILSKALSLDR